MCWREIWNSNLKQQGKANYNLNAQTALLKDKIKNKSLMERTLYNMFYNTTGDKTNYHKTRDNMIDHKKLDNLIYHESRDNLNYNKIPWKNPR